VTYEQIKYEPRTASSPPRSTGADKLNAFSGKDAVGTSGRDGPCRPRLPRRCLREPIPEIADTQTLLSEATDAHLPEGRTAVAAENFIQYSGIISLRNGP
jgi:hypothetical protein